MLKKINADDWEPDISQHKMPLVLLAIDQSDATAAVCCGGSRLIVHHHTKISKYCKCENFRKTLLYTTNIGVELKYFTQNYSQIIYNILQDLL
jgi:hypothetical protein